jgi:hypothetical protein
VVIFLVVGVKSFGVAGIAPPPGFSDGDHQVLIEMLEISVLSFDLSSNLDLVLIGVILNVMVSTLRLNKGLVLEVMVISLLTLTDVLAVVVVRLLGLGSLSSLVRWLFH